MPPRTRALMPDAPPQAIQNITRRFRLGPPAYGIAFALAFINTTASLLLLTAIALTYVLPYSD